MEPLAVLLMIVLGSILPDQFHADARKRPFWQDPFQMEPHISTAAVNLCVHNISEQAVDKCGLDPARYINCCPDNATDCLKQFDCSKTEGAADYFDALLRIGGAFTTCEPTENGNECRLLEWEELTPLFRCFREEESELRRCPHMDAETPKKCRGLNETSTCFGKVIACGNDTVLVRRFLEAVAVADYHRYCRDVKGDQEGKGWSKWLWALGALALVLMLASAVVVFCVLWKRKQGDTSRTKASSTVSANKSPTGSQGAKVRAKVGPQSPSMKTSSESVTFDSILSSKPPLAKPEAKFSYVSSKLDSKSGQTTKDNDSTPIPPDVASVRSSISALVRSPTGVASAETGVTSPIGGASTHTQKTSAHAQEGNSADADDKGGHLPSREERSVEVYNKMFASPKRPAPDGEDPDSPKSPDSKE